ncbi:hypothetical protein [Streptomyces europaeiscabiei]|uniref:hypothetical protein n=1 Tax=Streptomyces europaeiscabiei TaxID=146819 RepID=UPI0038F6AD5F
MTWQASRPALPNRSIVVARPVANVTVVTPRTTAASVRALRPGRANGRPSPSLTERGSRLPASRRWTPSARPARGALPALVIAYEKGLVRARDS